MVSLASAPALRASAATKPKKVQRDLLTGAVDPLDEPSQRKVFLRAAGADQELSATEFANDAKGGNGFVREFDDWGALLVFDENKSGTLDWDEARAYRLSMRENVLNAYDADQDGALTGQERESAIIALTGGAAIKPPAAVAATTAPASSEPATQPALGSAHRRFLGTYLKLDDPKEMLREYDRDGDGILSEAELRQAKQDRDRVMLEAYDANGDGRLSRTERFTGEIELIRIRARLRLDQYDVNGNGKLDPSELTKERQDKEQAAGQRK